MPQSGIQLVFVIPECANLGSTCVCHPALDAGSTFKGVYMNKLIKLAIEARKKAYAPYSKYKVGAALETKDGKIYTGCNIENASFGLAICAERVAASKAVSEGKKKFKRIAVVTSDRDLASPCGPCRQFLSEFSPEMTVIMANTRGKSKIYTLSELLPHSFVLKNQ